MQFKLADKVLNATVNIADTLEVSFSYNEYIKNQVIVDEMKTILGKPKWVKDKKIWSFEINDRTQWGIELLTGKNPYARYDAQYPALKPNRSNLRDYQIERLGWMLGCKQVIFAGEPGIGKTLTTIEAMELSGKKNWWWVGPRSALASVELDFERWSSFIKPEFMSYEGMTKRAQEPFEVPDGIVFDEAQRLKNWMAKRTQAGAHIGEYVRKNKGYVFLLTGTPAPKSPLDWWSLCEVVQPGFVRENSQAKFRNRVAIVKQEENASGQVFPNIIGFLDNPLKCAVCSQLKEHDIHLGDVVFAEIAGYDTHTFKESKNEVANLYTRLSGLVTVVRKKDCLTLPEKIYTQVILKPDKQTRNLAKAIVKVSRNTIQALTKLRALSDGFQYHDRYTGDIACVRCDAKGCIFCQNGVIRQFTEETVEIDTPKIPALLDIIEDTESRLIVFAGFHASIDRIVKNLPQGWDFIRIDGRGWHSKVKGRLEMLKWFQGTEDKICLVGHPGAAGTGLTLTASDTIVYYSNDFNSESRTQSEDRIHRIGSRGANIIDLIHLPVDAKVLESLKKKRELELLSLGELADAC